MIFSSPAISFAAPLVLSLNGPSYNDNGHFYDPLASCRFWIGEEGDESFLNCKSKKNPPKLLYQVFYLKGREFVNFLLGNIIWISLLHKINILLYPPDSSRVLAPNIMDHLFWKHKPSLLQVNISCSWLLFALYLTTFVQQMEHYNMGNFQRGKHFNFNCWA